MQIARSVTEGRQRELCNLNADTIARNSNSAGDRNQSLESYRAKQSIKGQAWPDDSNNAYFGTVNEKQAKVTANNHNSSPTGKSKGLMEKDHNRQGFNSNDSITLGKANQYTS